MTSRAFGAQEHVDLGFKQVLFQCRIERDIDRIPYRCFLAIPTMGAFEIARCFSGHWFWFSCYFSLFQ